MGVSQIAIAANSLICSRLALGVWRLAEWQMQPRERVAFIETALELGITTIDHADIYGNYTCEGLFGDALALKPGLRDQMQLITKCDIKLVSANRPEHTIKHYDTSQAHIVASVENSLNQLRTDRVDLLLLHRPDPLMDADETAEALMDLKQAGKILHVGVSNFQPSQFDLLASRLNFPIVTNQVEFSVTHLTPLYDGTFDQCQRLRIAPMAWSPLGGGDLFQSDSPSAKRLRSALQTIGEQLGNATIDQVALAWILRHPANIIPVLGTGKRDRLQSAAAAAQLQLSREQWFYILAASTGAPVP
ncbi:MAG TPA: aldo/keto reductase [Trichocoleus sp.]|jgi:predicted oxidoreductase